jgi:membrane-associated phospholipid phosphatase
MLAQIMRANGKELLGELDTLDRAVYAAVAGSRTPELDRYMARLSNSANYSRLSLASAAVLAATRGAKGREAAKLGLVSLAATAAVVNIVIKPLGRRQRPDPAAHRVPSVRRVRVPKSRSWPSGHTAAAFAFATGVSDVLPWDGAVLHVLATLVGYSRVHTGVHYPSDVLVGALTGTIVSRVVVDRLTRRAEGDPAERPQTDQPVLG